MDYHMLFLVVTWLHFGRCFLILLQMESLIFFSFTFKLLSMCCSNQNPQFLCSCLRQAACFMALGPCGQFSTDAGSRYHRLFGGKSDRLHAQSIFHIENFTFSRLQCSRKAPRPSSTPWPKTSTWKSQWFRKAESDWDGGWALKCEFHDLRVQCRWYQQSFSSQVFL